ncbi:endoglucanase [Lenzites betulinus]|nr:endoglucanase [Lenzites betulinus]
MKAVFVSIAVALASAAPALSTAVWGQCGGIGFSGDTTCAAGSACVAQNPYYSQCLPGAAAPTTTGSAPSASVCAGARTKFKLFGVNESGAEFGNNVIPGQLGKDYTWPSPTSIDFFLGQGFNTFRIPFLMERISPPSTGGLTGPFNSTYLDGLKQIVSYITGKGGFAVVDPHNFMIFNGATITSTSQFQAWWQTLANEFKTDENVIFDLMNEPHDIPAQTVFSLMQAAVNGVRASGATSQLILVEGTSWTGAWTWTTTSGNSAAFGAIKDPNNNVAIQMHQYLDSDGSGTSPTCVSSTIGAERLQAATAWLQQNNLNGFLGEIGAGNNTQCVTAVQGALCEMQQAGGTWLGALWWAAGPWWGDYYQSIEPPNGDAINNILPALKAFL